MKKKVAMSYTMPINELKVFYDDEKEIYTAEWLNEKMPFQTSTHEQMITICLGIQWGAFTTKKKFEY